MTEFSGIVAIPICEMSESKTAITLAQLVWAACGPGCGVTNFIVILLISVSLEDIVDRMVGDVVAVG